MKNKEKRFTKIPLLITLLLIFSISTAFAGVTGKFSGRIVDSNTGEPLPGVNVVIEGTAMGGATNVNGTYFIINIPVGTYNLTATMIGYKPVTKTGVKSIQDFTTTVNFDLEPTVVKVAGITVIAKRPMIQKDVTATTHFITTEDIDRRMSHDYNDIITEQAGVMMSEGGASSLTDGLHIRGGRADEIVYMVDGMSINDAITGDAGAQLNMGAIKEVVVQTGGFNAEYGQAMSGIINLVTKEGRKTEGLFRYTTDFPFKTDDTYTVTSNKEYEVGPSGGDLYEGFHRVELNFGGPVPGMKGLSYFLSSEGTMRDHQNSYYFPLSNSDREYYSLSGKLSYQITPTMKVALSGFNTREQWGQYCNSWGTPGESQWSEQDDKYKPPFEKAAAVRKASQGHFTFNHVLNKSTFYTVNLAYFKTEVMDAIRDAIFEDDRNFWEEMKFNHWTNYDIDEVTSPGMRTPEHDSLDFYAKDADGNYYYPWGVGGQSGNNFNFGYGASGYWNTRTTSYTDGKVDITSQITEHHQIKAGFEGKTHTAERYLGQYITDSDQARELDSLILCLYFDVYDYEPIQGALYVQDKIEYPGFVVNVGMRFDYLDTRAQKYIDPTNTEAGKVDAKPKYKISPRLGVSFPVTERTKLHVSYGQFFQIPRLLRLYDNINTDLATARGAWTRVGNPDLNAQQTTAYEIGLAHAFSPDAAIFVNLYYKDLYELTTVRFVPSLPRQYTQFYTEDYGNVKGAEFTFTQRATEYLSTNITYTLSQAKGTSSDELIAYYDYVANVPIDPVTGEPVPFPKADYPLEFDQRHMLAAELNLAIPDQAGPILGTIYPLQNLNINTLTSISSGLPYTRKNTSQLIVGETNAERLPWTWATDLKIRKDFKQWNFKYAIFAEITNIFNTRNIIKAFPETGKTDDNMKLSTFDGYISSTWPSDVGDVVPKGHSTYDERRDFNNNDEITKDEWYESYKLSYQDYLNSPYFYGDPRKIRVGISLSF